jgi:hypothetical protein
MGTLTAQDRLDHSRTVGDPLVRSEQPPSATAGSPPAVGSGSQRRSAATLARWSHISYWPSEQNGPNPGTSEEASSEKTGAGRALERRSKRDRSSRESRGRPRRDACAGCRTASSAGGRGSVRGGDEGGEHGHELKIRRPGRLRARGLSRRPATPTAVETARGRRDGAGREPAKAQVTGPLCRRPPTEGGGRTVSKICFEQNETFAWSRSMSETTPSC